MPLPPSRALPETKGRFVLNERLSIPFDQASELEVDLLCRGARIVVELDGAQHLADPIAYRNDRRKDQLLQENGYLVLSPVRCVSYHDPPCDDGCHQRLGPRSHDGDVFWNVTGRGLTAASGRSAV